MMAVWADFLAGGGGLPFEIVCSFETLDFFSLAALEATPQGKVKLSHIAFLAEGYHTLSHTKWASKREITFLRIWGNFGFR